MELTSYIESQLSSKQKGLITENRVAELIALGSKGRLTCYIPNSDDDGIDIIVNMKGQYKSLYIQVKSRYVISKNGTFIQNIGYNTFRSDERFYIIFVYFNSNTLEIENIWLIPSIDFENKAYLKKEGETYKSFYRFTANPRESKDKWEPYKISKTEVGNRIYEILNAPQDEGTIS